jgi:hypothetical protein
MWWQRQSPCLCWELNPNLIACSLVILTELPQLQSESVLVEVMHRYWEEYLPLFICQSCTLSCFHLTNLNEMAASTVFTMRVFTCTVNMLAMVWFGLVWFGFQFCILLWKSNAGAFIGCNQRFRVLQFTTIIPVCLEVCACF